MDICRYGEVECRIAVVAIDKVNLSLGWLIPAMTVSLDPM